MSAPTASGNRATPPASRPTAASPDLPACADKYGGRQGGPVLGAIRRGGAGASSAAAPYLVQPLGDRIVGLESRNWTEGGERWPRCGQPCRDARDRGLVDRLDLLDRFAGRNWPAEHQQLLAKLFGARTRALERHEDARLELRSSAADLVLARRRADLAKLVAHHSDDLGHIGLAGAGVDAKGAAVREARREGVDRVDEPALLAQFLEEAGR